MQNLRDYNERLIRALRQVVEARYNPRRLQDALDTAEAEVGRALEGRQRSDNRGGSVGPGTCPGGYFFAGNARSFSVSAASLSAPAVAATICGRVNHSSVQAVPERSVSCTRA